MKNIFKTFIAAVLITGFASCEDEQELKYVHPAASFNILTPQTGESVFLDPGQPDNPGIVVTWEDADYATPTEITYTVQVAATGTEFAAPVDITNTTNTYATISSETLNGAAVAAGLTAFEQGALDVRIKASVGATGSEPSYSNVIVYLVTPYVTYPYRDLYLVGSATAAGWENNATTNMYAMYRDPANEDIYYYTGYFAAGQFKLLEKKGQWAPQYGVNGSSLAPRPTEAEPDPSPFEVATAGYYDLMVNLSDNTYTFAPNTTADSATVYPTIGIIGTATPGGWDNDTDMTQSTFDPHIWYINNQFLTAGDGKLKFRANNAWDINWGSDTSYSGQGTQGGPDIPIGITTAGNYDIWFNDLTGRYIYIPVN